MASITPRFFTFPTLVFSLSAFASLSGCREVDGLDPSDPARGPGQMVGNGAPITDGVFHGGDDAIPAPADVPPPLEGAFDCDLACRSYCESAGLENPVNQGLCSSLWGVGLEGRPVDKSEACRRLYVDFLGRYPTPDEVNSTCMEGSWSEAVSALLDSEEFVLVQQRRWADTLLYNNEAVNVEGIFDMDDLVGKAYGGYVPWDLFATVTSAHPVFVRRYDTAGDRAEGLFKIFLGRPPYENERSDMARMYRLWSNGYWDHPHLGVVPDAYIEYACRDDNGEVTDQSSGECTSILWGYNQVILQPDARRENSGDQEGMMWSGYLEAEEWELLQTPGKILTREPAFWEYTVEVILEQMLGYDLATLAPEVRQELVKYLLQYDGDIRSVYFAIATSYAYMQSSQGWVEDAYTWTHGPLRQIPVEPWIDSLERISGTELGACDHRIPAPEMYMEEGTNWAKAMVRMSHWQVEGDEIQNDYRNLAQTLGGCPRNEVGGRFTTVSILNTAIQNGFLANMCDPGLAGGGMDINRLLPEGVSPNTALTESLAEDILKQQIRVFFGREATEEEIEEARAASVACTPQPCEAERFARPLCYSLASSAEMLFY